MMQTVLQDIESYGYIVIALFLFLGIVGIPAPEESLLFLVGVLAAQHQLMFRFVILASVTGALVGMLVAYVVGRQVGLPLVEKYGRFIGITKERWSKVKNKYTQNAHKTILFGFFMPGIRQISPYFAGMSRISFKNFFWISLFGAAIWNMLYILIGFYLGGIVNIDPSLIAYVGIGLFAIFIIQLVMKLIKRKAAN